MFKQAFKFAFVALVWKQYKHVIVSTLLLFFFIWLVSKIHQDYLSYSEMQDNVEVGWSFIVKWLALVSGVGVYLSFHFLRNTNNKKNNLSNRKPTTKQKEHTKDPFAELRNKKKLRSKADLLIERNKTSKR